MDCSQPIAREAGASCWVAEHHGGPMLAGPSPKALIGPIAAATTNIRVGSAGVMLPRYSPLKVAETFSVLAGLFPGRIDLGLGRAAGADPMTTYALQRDRRQASPDDFPEQLVELLGYLDDRLPPDHPLARLAKTLPGRPEEPEPWLLGSSPQSAIWAAAPRPERRAVVGSPETVRQQLAEVVESYGAEEAIVVCITYEHQARRRSYELLAEAFGL
jgi:luciferase family oxidoreductase group 1